MRMYPPLTAPNESPTALISASTTDARIAVPLYRFVTGRSIAPSTDAHDHEGAAKQLGLEGDADTGSLTLQRSSIGRLASHKPARYRTPACACSLSTLRARPEIATSLSVFTVNFACV